MGTPARNASRQTGPIPHHAALTQKTRRASLRRVLGKTNQSDKNTPVHRTSQPGFD
jgi:hypothetical protein